jgi:mono/diheme cytochrome c family protein
MSRLVGSKAALGDREPTVDLPVGAPVIRRFVLYLKKKWHKLAIFLFLFLAFAILINSTVARIYEFWDVGSNSWFARFRGDGWQFQRGAAMVKQDLFGDTFSTVKYLWQGWKPADSMWFYSTTQGSDLLPYDFFMALEKPGTTEPFHSNENMNFFRYLPQNATRSNPDGLPVGFVKDRYQGKDYLGFTCAACHTAQLNYNGTGIRIDGGPSGADMDSFLKALTEALTALNASNNLDARQRFVNRVMERGHYASENDVVKDLEIVSQRMVAYNVVNRSETRYGYSRLDAFGRIYNRVLEHVLNQTQLREVLQDLASSGKLTQAEADAILNEKVGAVLSGKQRDHIVERVAQLLPPKVQLELRNRIFNTPDAPVSYPFLWDTPQHDFVQWNGLVPNAGLGPVGRNASEAIGAFATLDWSEKPGFSLSSLLSGQGFKDEHISFNSSINVHNLRRMEDKLKSLQSPQWPEDILGRIDPSRRARGEALFANYCAGCHAEIDRADPHRRVVAHLSRLKDIGTDPTMAEHGVNYSGLSGILRNQYVAAGPGDMLIDKRAPVASLLTRTTISVVATPSGDKNFVRRGFDWADDLLTVLFSNDIKTSMKQGNYDPDSTAAPFSSLYSYKARSLNGIWATAPYLHNGSVPTLYDLLLPKKQPGDPDNGEYRPDKFQLGSREFDPKKVGFRSAGYEGFTLDTSRKGNSNAGHDYGTRNIVLPNGKTQEALTNEQRLDLLEYLKSL